MKCLFCNKELPSITEKMIKKHFFCEECQSYYHFLSETPEYFAYNAYPHMNLKKNFQNRHLQIPKNSTPG